MGYNLPMAFVWGRYLALTAWSTKAINRA